MTHSNDSFRKEEMKDFFTESSVFFFQVDISGGLKREFELLEKDPTFTEEIRIPNQLVPVQFDVDSR